MGILCFIPGKFNHVLKKHDGGNQFLRSVHVTMKEDNIDYLSDDGVLDEADLREVMKACMVENGMNFDEKEVSDLANALFDDAVKVCVLV